MLIDDLLIYLFDGHSHFLRAPLEDWLTSSRRFAAFITAYQTKIRKKIRTLQDAESMRDFQLELETAYLLLREKSLSIEYEFQHPREGRSPDFAVSFTTSIVFMVEVTRMRPAPPKVLEDAQDQTSDSVPGERFADTLSSKLGQLQPQHSNVLLIGMESPLIAQSDLQAVMLRTQHRAENNDTSIVQRHSFRDRADFFRYYQRLSALLIRPVPLQAGETVILWDNPQAKHPLPAKVRTALVRSHTL